jgi:hypothetical protein
MGQIAILLISFVLAASKRLDAMFRANRICAAGFLLASGLSGTFCFFLLSIAVIIAYVKRKRWRLIRVYFCFRVR